jgi:predicted glutamine amidotransferase
MCGLVGVCGQVGAKEEKAFAQMLIVDSLRGTDSTGAAIIPRHNEVRVVKALGNPFNLLDSKQYDKALVGVHRALIGHNRFATQGKVSTINAHPFDFDELVGAHNGTLTSKWRLLDAKDFDVDSQNLYHHIHEKGLKDALNFMEGAWALTWWDKVNEEMNFLRNDQRPLWFAKSEDGKCLFWASESWMLSGVAAREVKLGELLFLDKDMHMTIKIPSTGVMEKARVTAAPATFRPPVYPIYGYQGTVVKKTTETTGATDATTRGNLTLVDNTTNPPKATALTSSETGTPTSYDSYENSKNVRLAISYIGRDVNGASYFGCKDELNPAKIIRLYYTSKSGTGIEHVGKSFVCQIGNAHASSTGRFYKAVASSVKWDEVEEEATYLGVKNQRFKMAEWMAKYGSCEWCSSLILPTDAHAISKEGQAFCDDCISNNEVLNYIEVDVHAHATKVAHPF